jgi:serine/threonine protein kinase
LTLVRNFSFCVDLVNNAIPFGEGIKLSIQMNLNQISLFCSLEGMGSGLSSNYVQDRAMFVVNGWRVFAAHHSETGVNVTLWMLDAQLLAEKLPNADDRSSFISGWLAGIKTSRCFRHPHILKVLEVQDNPQCFEFTTEPVDSCVKGRVGESALSKVEATYVALQLIDTLEFLHKSGQMHLGVSGSSVFLSNMSVKLFGFNWASPLEGSKPVPFGLGLHFPNLWTSAPEVIKGETRGLSADVFSFGAVIYEVLVGKRPVSWLAIEECVPDKVDTSGLESAFAFVSTCLRFKAAERPTFDAILGESAFSTLEMKVLKYLDNILLKAPKDKSDFSGGCKKPSRISRPRYSSRELCRSFWKK